MDATRTCLACRHKDDRSLLLRFVRACDGEICFDEKASFPSRGAWLCPKKECLAKAFGKRLLFRDEKTLAVNAEAMKNTVATHIKASVLSRLGLLKRMGQIEAGRNAVLSLVKEKRAALVLTTSDFAVRSLQEVKANLAGQTIVCLQSPFTMEEFGNCLGRPKTGVVALSKSRITDEILIRVNRLSLLGL